MSIDTKKKELVGNFKNAGVAWNHTPHLVDAHDFPSAADDIAIPHGVYDVSANVGAVFVGTSHDTPHFAADNLARWWQREGHRRYPRATEILVLADGGGSNGVRCNVFKYALQERLADPYRLSITVCHYPTGASKWNPVDHRLFSEICKNWAGCPLRTYETVLNHIRTTRTQTGLRVRAYLIAKKYPTGVQISKEQQTPGGARSTRSRR